jgi:hypothetical protein
VGGEGSQPFGDGSDDHPAAVARVKLPADVPGPFQPVDHAGDRSGGPQAGLLTEFAGGERAGLGKEIQAAQVGDVEVEPVGDRLVEQDAVGGAALGGALELSQQHGPSLTGFIAGLTLAGRRG